jgi:hypothetical protein
MTGSPAENASSITSPNASWHIDGKTKTSAAA